VVGGDSNNALHAPHGIVDRLQDQLHCMPIK
jgi:hypothetical protein